MFRGIAAVGFCRTFATAAENNAPKLRKKVLTPFNVFIGENLKGTKGPVIERMKSLAESWKGMDENAKTVYKNKAQEMNGVEVMIEVQPRSTMVSQEKKPMTSYAFFTKSKFANVAGANAVERMKALGQQWKTLTEEEKAEWGRQAVEASQAPGRVKRVRVAAKRAVLPINLFIKTKIAEGALKDLKGQERMKQLRAAWTELSEEGRQPWKEEAEKQTKKAQNESKPVPLAASGRHRFISSMWSQVSGDIGVRSKQLAALWKELPVTEKERWCKLAQKEKEVPKKAKHETKKPPSAFNEFIREQYPTAKGDSSQEKNGVDGGDLAGND